MLINEIIFMQIRIVRLFCERYALNVNAINKLFIDNKIYELIEDCYDSYHCGSDEIVYSDVRDILVKNGALA